MGISLAEWKLKLRGVPADKLLATWRDRARDEVSYVQEPWFHLAAAERMWNLAFMAIDLEDHERANLRGRGDAIVTKLRDVHGKDEAILDVIEEVQSSCERYHNRYGTRTARYYMYEQGIIDLLGDRPVSA